MKRLIILAAVCLLAACATTTQTRDVLAEAHAAYTALADVEKVAGDYCAANPTVSPCPSVPFAKIAAVDAEIYLNLQAADIAAAASNATAESVALGVIKADLPQAFSLIPPSKDPTVAAAVAALEIAITTFIADLGAP